MSDRDKGAEDVLANVTRLFYLQHLKRNSQVKFGEKLVGCFWGIANSTTGQNFHHSMSHLRQESTAAADYLVRTDSRMWVNATIPGDVSRRFSQQTSNAVESMNNSPKTIRSHGILDILMGL